MSLPSGMADFVPYHLLQKAYGKADRMAKNDKFNAQCFG